MEQPILTRSRVSDARPVLPAGFKASALHCGIRARRNKLDLGLIVGAQAFPAAAILLPPGRTPPAIFGCLADFKPATCTHKMTSGCLIRLSINGSG